ncbi:MAG TPA: hypothetical protein VK027_00720 [Chitinophagaceae bacterium]|nr:hypothetical protein [Chitinophagaceae bacterium]
MGNENEDNGMKKNSKYKTFHLIPIIAIILIFIKASFSHSYGQNVLERKELDDNKYTILLIQDDSTEYKYIYQLVDKNNKVITKDDLEIGNYFLQLGERKEASFSFDKNTHINGQIFFKNTGGDIVNIFYIKDGYLTKMYKFDHKYKKRTEFFYQVDSITSYWYTDGSLYKKMISKNCDKRRQAFEYNEVYTPQNELIFKEDRVDEVYKYYINNKKRLEIGVKNNKLKLFDEIGKGIKSFKDIEDNVFRVEELNEKRLILVLNKEEKYHYYLFEYGIFQQKDIIDLKEAYIEIFNKDGKLKEQGNILKIPSSIMGPTFFMKLMKTLKRKKI